MPNVNFILLYVENVERSADFYARLLEISVLEAAPTFAMLPLGPALMLGLWRRDGVLPPAQGAPGGGEIALTLDDDAAVDALHARWRDLGAPIAQAPTHADFGYTFLALDPDGHRVRAFHPANG